MLDRPSGRDIVASNNHIPPPHVREARHLTDLQRVDHRADAFSMMTTIFDEPDRVNTELDRYRAVTTAQVREFASAFLGADNRAILTYLPRAGS